MCFFCCTWRSLVYNYGIHQPQQRAVMPFASIRSHSDFKGLNEGQKIAALAAMEPGNMLLSGGGGVGKSHLIKILCTFIPSLVLTASTGAAAVNILGQTIDSFMGFNKSIRTPSQAAFMDEKTKERLSVLTHLLIDEVSMTRADKLDMIDTRLKAAKESARPFGGVKVILVGDFCQLPPVVSNSFSDREYKKAYGERLFAFESHAYERARFVPYILNEYVRQGDIETRRHLRNLRMGHRVDAAVDFINRSALGEVSEGSLRICKTNARVNDINRYSFLKLNTPIFTAHSVKEGYFPNNAAPVDEKIPLRQNCRLLIMTNEPERGYLNGDLGVFVGFQNEHLVVDLDRGGRVYVETKTWENSAYENEGDEGLERKAVGRFTQYPVRLGYAITGHKSQGMTLDSAVVDFSGGFNADGLAYVILSRVKSFNNLKLTEPLTAKDVKTSIKARDFTFKISMNALARREKDKAYYLREECKYAA